MANQYYLTVPDGFTLPSNGNSVALSTACLLHRIDGATPKGGTIAAGDYLGASVSLFDAFTSVDASGITHIETLSATSWDGSANVERTLTFTQTILENDLIIVTRGRADGSTMTALSGYTLRQNNLNLNSNAGRITTDWLKATSSPPTSVVVPSEGGTNPVTIRVDVFRGTNASPFSVSDTTANGTAGSSLAAASITPAHADCYIYGVAIYNDRGVGMDSYPANLPSIQGVLDGGITSTTTNNTLASAGALLEGGSGSPFSPGTWDFGGSQAEGITAITMALRPA